MALSNKEKEKLRSSKQSQEKKDLSRILADITESIKDTTSVEVIKESINAVEKAITEIDDNKEVNLNLLKIFKEIKLSNSTDNNKLQNTLDKMIDSLSNFDKVKQSLESLTQYLEDSRQAEWEFDIKRDSFLNIEKVIAKRNN